MNDLTTTTTTNIQPAGHTQATFESRIAYIEQGHEAHFRDAEVAQALEALSGFAHITAVRACPSAGFTRLSARTFLLTGEARITYAG